MQIQKPKILSRLDGSHIAYYQTLGALPGVIFLSGFMSDMMGIKACYIEKLCREWGRAFIRFDYFGHGASFGEFEEGSIGRWKNDTLAVLDELTVGPQVLVGSSMGGWIMMLASLARSERIAGLVGIASAPDFTEYLVEKLPPIYRQELEANGVCYIPSVYGKKPYAFTKKLIDDGHAHHVLGNPIPIHCPVRLVHGFNDEDVSWQQSVRLLECLESKDAQLTLIKGGNHRLSTEEHLNVIGEKLKELLEKSLKSPLTPPFQSGEHEHSKNSQRGDY